MPQLERITCEKRPGTDSKRLKEAWYKVLPSPVSDGFKQALHWHIKDFSPREVSAAAQRMTDYADAAILELPGEEL